MTFVVSNHLFCMNYFRFIYLFTHLCAGMFIISFATCWELLTAKSRFAAWLNPGADRYFLRLKKIKRQNGLIAHTKRLTKYAFLMWVMLLNQRCFLNVSSLCRHMPAPSTPCRDAPNHPKVSLRVCVIAFCSALCPVYPLSDVESGHVLGQGCVAQLL